MISLERETLLSIRQAARRIPGRRGKPIHVSAVYRWIQRGVDGVRLEVVRVGGTTYTSAESLQRFSEALTQARHGDQPSPTRLRTSSNNARKELERHGF